jgi:hypothetical protein
MNNSRSVGLRSGRPTETVCQTVCLLATLFPSRPCHLKVNQKYLSLMTNPMTNPTPNYLNLLSLSLGCNEFQKFISAILMTIAKDDTYWNLIHWWIDEAIKATTIPFIYTLLITYLVLLWLHRASESLARRDGSSRDRSPDYDCADR